VALPARSRAEDTRRDLPFASDPPPRIANGAATETGLSTTSAPTAESDPKPTCNAFRFVSAEAPRQSV